jgi:hypothetical protein
MVMIDNRLCSRITTKELTPFSAADMIRFGQSSLSMRSTRLGFQCPIKLSIASGQSRGANCVNQNRRK